MFKFTAKEENIDCWGMSFVCIYGTHINGGYVAITNWGVAAELSDHQGDTAYNRGKILEALERSPYVSYLPRDDKARLSLANDLAGIISAKIGELTAPTHKDYLGQGG